MYIKYLKVSLFSVTMALACNAQAGLIDTAKDSYIDNVSGLEWMDFGINVHYTYNEVVAELNEGGVYAGWRLPTSQEVVTMWENAFLGLGQDVEIETYSSGSSFSWISAFSTNGELSTIFDIMNVPIIAKDINDLDNNDLSARLFDGGLDILWFIVSRELVNNVEYTDSFLLFVYDFETGFEGLNILRNTADPYTGTLLVRNPVSVHEPSVLAIFTLGLLTLRFFRKYRV